MNVSAAQLDLAKAAIGNLQYALLGAGAMLPEKTNSANFASLRTEGSRPAEISSPSPAVLRQNRSYSTLDC